MSATPKQIPEITVAGASVDDLFARVSAFEGERDVFLALLARFAARLTSASVAAVADASGVVVSSPASVDGTHQTLAEELSRTARSGTASVRRPNDGTAIIAQPLGDSLALGVVIASGDEGVVRLTRERLVLTTQLYLAYTGRVHSARSRVLEWARETGDALDRQPDLEAAGLELCNRVSARLGARHVVFATTNDRVRCVAVSDNTELSRTSRAVQDIERVIESEIETPPDQRPCREVGEYRERSGAASLEIIELLDNEQAVGTLLIDSGTSDHGLAELLPAFGARTEAARRRGRSHAVGAPARFLRRLFGPRHALTKAITAGVLLFFAFAAFFPVADTAGAPFECVPRTERRVVARTPGVVHEVPVRTGDRVIADETVLARIGAEDLELELSALVAERGGHAREADAARGSDATALRLAELAVERLDARIELVRKGIARATLVAPIDGIIVTPDPERLVGSTVNPGDALITVADTDELIASLYVPEQRAHLVEPGQQVTLTTIARPGHGIKGRVERVHPLAQVVAGRNVYRVECALADRPGWMRAGMEGRAEIGVGRTTLLKRWTRPITDRVRLMLGML